MEELNLDEMLSNMEDNGECDNSENIFLKDNILKIDTEKLSSSKLDTNKFKDGIDSVSFLCGAITALVNVGINPNKAMDYIVDKEATEIAMKHNIEMANIQKDISVETAKFNFVNKVDNF